MSDLSVFSLAQKYGLSQMEMEKLLKSNNISYSGRFNPVVDDYYEARIAELAVKLK